MTGPVEGGGAHPARTPEAAPIPVSPTTQTFCMEAHLAPAGVLSLEGTRRSIAVGVCVLLLATTVPAAGTQPTDASSIQEPADQSPAPGVFAVVQLGEDPVVATVEPLSTGETVESFYNYNGVRNSADPPVDILRSNVSNLFLFDGPDGLSMVIVHDRHYDGDGGTATFNFTGLPEEGAWVVQDDPDHPPDTFSTDGAFWEFNGRWTDGGAYRGLGDVPAVTVEATFGTAYGGTIDSWQFLSGDPADPDRIELSPGQPVTIVGLH